MGLKAVLPSRAEFDALPEAVRGLYAELDGKFVLQVDGLVPEATATDLKTKLAEFRDNNRTLFTELEQLRPLKAKFEGIDPDEYRTLKAEREKAAGKNDKKQDELDAMIRAAVEAAVTPLKGALETERGARMDATKRANSLRFRELVTAEASKARVRANGMRFVLNEAEGKFELKDDALVAREGVRHHADPLKALTPAEWLTELARTDDYLFEPSKGGGAAPGSPAGAGAPFNGSFRTASGAEVKTDGISILS